MAVRSCYLCDDVACANTASGIPLCVRCLKDNGADVEAPKNWVIVRGRHQGIKEYERAKPQRKWSALSYLDV